MDTNNSDDLKVGERCPAYNEIGFTNGKVLCRPPSPPPAYRSHGQPLPPPPLNPPPYILPSNAPQSPPPIFHVVPLPQRLLFLRNVYIFHIAQLYILNAFLCILFYSSSLRRYIFDDLELVPMALASEFVLVILLITCHKLKASLSAKMLLLLACSIVLSFWLAVSAAFVLATEMLITTVSQVVVTGFLFLLAYYYPPRKGIRNAFGWFIAVIPVLAISIVYSLYFPVGQMNFFFVFVAPFILPLYTLCDIDKVFNETHSLSSISSPSVSSRAMLLQNYTFGICFLICLFKCILLFFIFQYI